MEDRFSDEAMYNQHKDWEAEQEFQASESARVQADIQAQEAVVEDKEAIEAIARDLWLLEIDDPTIKGWDWETIKINSPITANKCLNKAKTLASLGYVKQEPVKKPCPECGGRGKNDYHNTGNLRE